jgi:hypothetical protein
MRACCHYGERVVLEPRDWEGLFFLSYSVVLFQRHVYVIENIRGNTLSCVPAVSDDELDTHGRIGRLPKGEQGSHVDRMAR